MENEELSYLNYTLKIRKSTGFVGLFREYVIHST